MEFTYFNETMLPGIAELLQRAFPLHEISIRSVRRITVEDPNFVPDDLVVARDEKGLLGAVIGARYRKEPPGREADPNAFVKAICTVPFSRPLMHDLLARMESRLKSEGAGSLVYSNFASWHLLPGADLRYENLLEFLASEGFGKRGQCVDYVIDLQAFRVPRRISAISQDLRSRGILMRLAAADEIERVKAWVLEHFSYNWSYEAGKAVGRTGAGVWLAEEGGQILGFSVFGGLEYHWFGPVGVLEGRRKGGLGSALLFKTLESMKALSIPRAIIPWTGHLFFYTQVPGIVGTRHYWMMGKELR